MTTIVLLRKPVSVDQNQAIKVQVLISVLSFSVEILTFFYLCLSGFYIGQTGETRPKLNEQTWTEAIEKSL